MLTFIKGMSAFLSKMLIFLLFHQVLYLLKDENHGKIMEKYCNWLRNTGFSLVEVVFQGDRKNLVQNFCGVEFSRFNFSSSFQSRCLF